MPTPDRLTVKVTVRIREAAAGNLRFNSLVGSLMIESEQGERFLPGARALTTGGQV
jgi:hypothetical protein